MLTLRVSWVVSLASEGAKIALGSVAAADFHVGHYGLGELGGTWRARENFEASGLGVSLWSAKSFLAGTFLARSLCFFFCLGSIF